MTQSLYRRAFGLVALLTLVNMQAAEDPAAAAEAKLRDSLRATVMQLRTAETERATLQATQAQAEAMSKDLQVKLDAMTKKSAEDQAAARKAEQALEEKNQQLTAKLKRYEESFNALKAEHEKALEVLKQKEVALLQLQDEKTVLEARVRDRQLQNMELYRTATEILKRYESFSLGEAIKAREPFTGITRARLESQVEEYRDQVNDHRYVAPAAPKVDQSAVAQPKH